MLEARVMLSSSNLPSQPVIHWLLAPAEDQSPLICPCYYTLIPLFSKEPLEHHKSCLAERRNQGETLNVLRSTLEFFCCISQGPAASSSASPWCSRTTAVTICWSCRPAAGLRCATGASHCLLQV